VRRRLFTVATAISLVLCLAISVLLVRSGRVHSRVGYSTSEARYTLHSVDGALTLSGPPAKASDDSVVRGLVNGMSNGDVVFKIGGDGNMVNWECRDGGGKSLMQHWVNTDSH
jgi:hypothetical protein